MPRCCLQRKVPLPTSQWCRRRESCSDFLGTFFLKSGVTSLALLPHTSLVSWGSCRSNSHLIYHIIYHSLAKHSISYHKQAENKELGRKSNNILSHWSLNFKVPGDLVKMQMLGPAPRDSVGLGRDPRVLSLTSLQVCWCCWSRVWVFSWPTGCEKEGLTRDCSDRARPSHEMVLQRIAVRPYVFPLKVWVYKVRDSEAISS